MNVNVILQGVVGSTAYGLSTPDSDVDRLGVFTATVPELLGMQPVQESLVRTDPDSTHHELRKFLHLAAKGNPTVLELLFLESYEIAEDAGWLLLENSDAFLSQRIRRTYGGYALQQVKRLEVREDGSFSSDLRKRRRKHQRHIARLVIQCEEALEIGQLRVRLTPAQIAEVREVEGIENTEQLVEWFSERDDRIRNMPSDLPLDADWDRINELLLQIRGVQ
jgi:predicted nucleotidyltransferase